MKNKRPQTTGEEIANMVTHVIGSHLGAAMLTLLVWQGFSSGNLEYPTDNENDLAVINYTSGTTSAPKGVMLKYGNFSATVDFASEKVTPGEDNRLVSMLPMGHIYGLVIELIFPLCSGCTIYYLGKTPSPTLLLKAMKDIKPFMVVTVPLVMEKVYKSSIKPAISRFPVNILIHIPVISHFIYKKIGVKLMDAFGGRVRHFIMGGAVYHFPIKIGQAALYVELTGRTAIRSGSSGYDIENYDQYEIWQSNKIASDMTPFYECFGGRGEWDVGASIAVGQDSEFGDLQLGFGLNNHLQASVFVNLR